MKEEYKKEMDTIKAPRDLIERTKIEMRKEMAKKAQTNEKVEAETPVHVIPEPTVSDSEKTKAPIINITFRQTAIVSAAVLLIIVGTFGYLKSQTTINIQAVSETSMTLNPNLGKGSGNNQGTQDKMTVVSGADQSIVPEFLQEIKASKIKGHSVQLGVDKKGIYHASYKVADTYYYVTGTDVSEEEFINFLKNKF